MADVMTTTEPRQWPRPCRHDSTRRDGTLDNHCLSCGWPGYWHDGHRHDHQWHGKVLIELRCPGSASPTTREASHG